MRTLLGSVYHRIRGIVPRSQSNEQALLEQSLRDITVPHTFCEFGFDPDEFNCAQLAMTGWRGLLIDGNAQKVAAAQSLFPRHITVLCEYLYIENVYDIVAHHYPRHQLGVLSVDVDGNDYWFLRALLPLQPGVVICEYNASLLHHSITVPYDAQFDRHAKHPRGFYHGASLSALTALCSEHQYDLVAVSDSGLNALFCRRDLRPAATPLDPVLAYRPNLLRAHYNDGMTAEQQWESIRELPFLPNLKSSRLFSTDGEEALGRPHEHHALGKRGRCHECLAHRVHRDYLELSSGCDDDDVAVFT
jgi:hypothetical protein